MEEEREKEADGGEGHEPQPEEQEERLEDAYDVRSIVLFYRTRTKLIRRPYSSTNARCENKRPQLLPLLQPFPSLPQPSLRRRPLFPSHHRQPQPRQVSRSRGQRRRATSSPASVDELDLALSGRRADRLFRRRSLEDREPRAATTAAGAVRRSDQFVSLFLLPSSFELTFLSGRPQSWASLIDPSALENLPDKERKRQEACYELIATEQSYVQSLQLCIEVCPPFPPSR